MKITDSDIIDSLLEDASSKVEEDLYHISIHDAGTTERFRQWSSVLSRMQLEREAHHALQNRAMGRVIQRIAEEESSQHESNVSSVDWGGLIRPTRMRVGGLFAVAAGMLLIVGYFALSTTPLGSIANSVPVASTEIVKYVAFGFEGEGIGTDSQPYATLSEAVASVHLGEVVRIGAGESREAIRIAKPMRLEAIGGSVRIGNL